MSSQCSHRIQIYHTVPEVIRGFPQSLHSNPQATAASFLILYSSSFANIKLFDALQYDLLPMLLNKVHINKSKLFLCLIIKHHTMKKCRPQRPRGLRHEINSPVRTLGSWVWIPIGAWISVCVFVCVLHCVGSGLVTGWSPVQGFLPTVCKINKTHIYSEWEKARKRNPSTMKTYGRAEVELHVFLISALNGGEWSPSHPGRYNPRYPLVSGLGEPHIRSGSGEEKKISCHCWELNPKAVSRICLLLL
jgi:hypothetical protein